MRGSWGMGWRVGVGCREDSDEVGVEVDSNLIDECIVICRRRVSGGIPDSETKTGVSSSRVVMAVRQINPTVGYYGT